MRTVIVYESTHHGNTKKLIDAIKAEHEVDVIEFNKVDGEFLKQYDLIGFASGIAFGKFYEGITEVIKNKLPAGKKVFFIYTCGRNSKDFSTHPRKIIEQIGCETVGSYGCHGFDTYGPFKLVGGINKNHPDANEIKGAVEFYSNILK
ncbi:MAG: flavodoxin [Oscillospiraceae bacterium]|nr:flavodoxin [Oscillospiraceae bacterium]MBP1556572.1 flavodoxin [Oscillospiraceae bacterium]